MLKELFVLLEYRLHPLDMDMTAVFSLLCANRVLNPLKTLPNERTKMVWKQMFLMSSLSYVNVLV